MLEYLWNLLFPPRCVLCGSFLSKEQTDFCHPCREHAPEFKNSNFPISFVAGWTGVWYYKDMVRGSILRYKFGGRRSYASAYGRILAMKLQKEKLTDFDMLTFVPIAPFRKLFRGYDQVELLANAVGAELGIHSCRTLRKVRNTPPQSGIREESRRRANVLGAYAPDTSVSVQGRRILLLDDVITTGATISECARVLLTAGAKEVFCASVAVTNKRRR